VARSKRISWENLSDEDLLKVRICDLGVRIEGSEVEPRLWQLYDELQDLNLFLRPRCFLSDEWLSPNGQPAIGIPFYLVHPRLKALEFRMMFEIEGGTPSACMKLLRHEAAHAIDHAYGLHRRDDWRQTFGSPRKRYSPYLYMADPHSKHHVRNLPDNYAQCHPEEDYAETFAVWLNPSSQWRTRYKGWPAMRKLRYVDRAMRELSELPVPRRRPVLHSEVRSLRSTLQSYYRKKYRLHRRGDLDYAVRDLKTIFRVSRAREPDDLASALIRGSKRRLVDSISRWSGERPGRISAVLTSLAKLCDEHRLVLREEPETSLVKLTTYATTLVLNRVHGSAYRPRKR
jgi:hypothetical protein